MNLLNRIEDKVKQSILTLSFAICIISFATYPSQGYATITLPANNQKTVKVSEAPKIQLAILLDTSNSMDGLINQSREQIWQVINQLSQTSQNGIKPGLEVAIYEYGNDRLSSKNGYVRKVTGLTSELDEVSEALFSLTTNGGQEYCGYVIKTAVADLNWSKSDNDVKIIFIAGNEPFTQGPVPFQKSINRAKQKGIVVNTIYAGNHKEGLNSGWQEGAVLAGGNFMSIDQNQKVTHVNAPQDKRLAELNKQLNSTYIPYGTQGMAMAERQKKQDSLSNNVSSGLLAKRTKSKATSYYRNTSWDLVDAEADGKVDLDTISEDKLPAAMLAMSKVERKAHIKKNATQRKEIQNEILKLSNQRDQYVNEENKKRAKENIKTMDDALSRAILVQAKKKNFVFNKGEK